MSVDYYVVLDFEATCDDATKIYPQEIIEWPSVLIDAETNTVIDTIQLYIKPKANPLLSSFCTDLTGITQAVVDEGCSFNEAYQMYMDWLRGHGLLDPEVSFVFCTCGDWDLNTMFPFACGLYGIKDWDPCFDEWLNVKVLYFQVIGKKAYGMKGMLDDLRLDLLGRHHSGIDDCKNIGRIVLALVALGGIVRPSMVRSLVPPKRYPKYTTVKYMHYQLMAGNLWKDMVKVKLYSGVEAVVVCDGKDKTIDRTRKVLLDTYALEVGQPINDTSITCMILINLIVVALDIFQSITQTYETILFLSTTMEQSAIVLYGTLCYLGMPREKAKLKLFKANQAYQRNIDESSFEWMNIVLNAIEKRLNQ